MIDLNLDPKNNVRQVDHRTIEYIIYKNVKYCLKKKSKGQKNDELPLKVKLENQKWKANKLAESNWFSQINYYKVKDLFIEYAQVISSSDNKEKELTIARDILEKEMHSASIFYETKKVTRTEIVEILRNTKE